VLPPAVCRGICHGDVYAHNVMADEQGQTVLCDYGAPVWCAGCVCTSGPVAEPPNGSACLPACGVLQPWHPAPHTPPAALLCLPAGASFPYHKGGPVKYEAQEVRAFGLMLADLVQRLEIEFKGGRSNSAVRRCTEHCSGEMRSAVREGRQAGSSSSTTTTHHRPHLRPHPLAGCAAQAWSSFWTPSVSCWEWCACAWAHPLWGAPPLALSGAACAASRSRRGGMGWQRSPPAGLLAGSTHCLYRLCNHPACSAGLEAALAVRQSPAATNNAPAGLPAMHCLAWCSDASMLTPRTCVTEGLMTPRSPFKMP
jgi:hypothetical protein